MTLPVVWRQFADKYSYIIWVRKLLFPHTSTNQYWLYPIRQLVPNRVYSPASNKVILKTASTTFLREEIELCNSPITSNIWSDN